MPNWILLAVLGIVSIIAGILALLNPFPASLAAVKLAAWAFLIIGAVQIFEAFSAKSWGGKLWTLLLGVVAVLIGVDLLGEPLAGLIKLTFVLGIMFIASGIFKFIAGFRVHRNDFKALVLVSGLASLAIGLIILSNFPASAATSLGILLGIELVSDGVSALALALSRRAGGVAQA
jgi:membrane protein HdeD